jgi:hypothetical protein
VSDAEAIARAAELRGRHKIGQAPLRDIHAFVEGTLGHDLTITAMPEVLDGMTLVDPAGVVLIAVAATSNPERQRFTIAHELGHIVFDVLAPTGATVHDESSGVESKISDFARHLLLPPEGMAQVLRDAGAVPGTVSDEQFSQVLRVFGISSEVARIQMREGGWLDRHDPERPTAEVLSVRFGWSAERRDDVAQSRQEQRPQRMLANANTAYFAGAWTLARTARVHGISVEKLGAEFTDAGLSRTALPAESPTTPNDPFAAFG